MVSHDRYLLDNVANKIWYIEDQQIKIYPGTYAEYEDWKQKQAQGIAESAKIVEVKKTIQQEKVKEVADDSKVKKLKKLNQQLSTIEQQVTNLQQQLLAVEKLLADEKIYQDPVALKTQTSQYDVLKDALKVCKVEWEQMAEQIFELEN